jgi:hypothetical protein
MWDSKGNPVQVNRLDSTGDTFITIDEKSAVRLKSELTKRRIECLLEVGTLDLGAGDFVDATINFGLLHEDEANRIQCVINAIDVNMKDDEESWKVKAWHEAGHAVVAYKLGWEVTLIYASVTPRPNGDGGTSCIPPIPEDRGVKRADESVQCLRDRIVIACAGEAGEKLLDRALTSSGIAGDKQTIKECFKILQNRQIPIDLEELAEEAEMIVENHRTAVEFVAETILSQNNPQGTIVKGIPGGLDPMGVLLQAMFVR